MHTQNTTPLHKYMQIHNSKTFRTFVLQHTTPENLDKAEKEWIARLQTQSNNRFPDNLNYEKSFLISKKYNKQTNTQTHKTTERLFASRDYARRIIFLNQTNNKEQYLNSLNPQSLRQILSTLLNKEIQPVIPRKLTKPTIYLQHSYPPNPHTIYSHNTIKKQLTQVNIKELVLLSTNALHKKISPTITKQKLRLPISTTFISQTLNRRTLTNIFTKAQSLLPLTIKDKIDTAIIYKNLNTTATLFFNYKETANTPINNTTNTPTCLCHLQKFEKYINAHGHIDTNNTDILTNIECHLHLKPTNIQELANKGANFIIQPYTTPKIIQKHFSKDINKFIDKITLQFKLPSYIFQEWKMYINKQIHQITNTIPITNSAYNIFNIKNSLYHIHKHLTCAPTDKLKNNYRFTCNTYTQRLITLKITNQPTLICNPNTIANVTTETTNKTVYEQSPYTVNEIITQHNIFLAKYQLTTNFTKLPYVYIMHKAHKNGNRGVTSAFNVSTSTLAKTLHTSL
jgi:hypothetical protein